ncbi:MAG: thiamine phosphate synthase [Planctomycetota bacterium]
MPPVTRILDANFNRGREALRVMEEAARFLLNDAELSERLKQLRHDLTAAVGTVATLTLDRDTPGDVGTTISNRTERDRASVAQVIDAAGARLGEALRAIEEYAKVLGEEGPGLAQTVEQLRYRGYELSLQLTRKLGPGLPRQWRLCLLLTEVLCRHHPWQHVLSEALRAGADSVQVREKQMEGGELLARVREVIGIVGGRAAVIVNDRPDIAMLAGADGVHLGQTDMPVAEARRLFGRQLIIGVSTSQIDEAQRAKQDGADYCGIGPMYMTQTKRKDYVAGPRYLREYATWDGLPHLAIGGITPNNIGDLAQLGCHGVAISSAICDSQDPYTVARAVLSKLPAQAAAHV